MHDSSDLYSGYKNGRWLSLIISEHTLVCATICVVIYAAECIFMKKGKKDIRVNFLCIKSRKVILVRHLYALLYFSCLPKLPLTYSAHSKIHASFNFFNSKHLNFYQYWTDKFPSSIISTIGGIAKFVFPLVMGWV